MNQSFWGLHLLVLTYHHERPIVCSLTSGSTDIYRSSHANIQVSTLLCFQLWFCAKLWFQLALFG